MNAGIKALKTGKAPGEDDIRPEMLKAMNIHGVLWLTRVCKVACSTGQAPKQWHTSVIIPIHKKGDKRKCTNYRGISLISVPGKVYAKCLEKKCREIVEPLLTDAQCGFRPGPSTMDLFGCIFILLSRESDQCAIRARLGVAGHLSTTPRWGNPAKCLSQRHNK